MAPPKPKPSARQAFNIAMAFHEGSIRCEGELDPGTAAKGPLLAPTLVCAAFTAELYMKALVLRRVPDVDGHNLYWLYKNALGDAERQSIAKHYKAERGADSARLEAELKAFARAFVEWRYVYESERGIDTGALFAFVRSAYMAVRELAAHWPVSEREHERLTSRSSMVMVMYGSKGITEFLASRGIVKPQPDLTKGENQNLSVAAPRLDLDRKSAALNVKIDRGADSEDDSPNKPLE